MRNNTFTEEELPLYTGKTGEAVHGVPAEIWKRVFTTLGGTFVKVGELYTLSGPGEVEPPPTMRQKPTWLPSASVFPTRPPSPPRRKAEELEFLADSPEWVTQTIDNSGWREKLDQEFQAAIARARGR